MTLPPRCASADLADDVEVVRDAIPEVSVADVKMRR
jgi:hypothetical protein